MINTRQCLPSCAVPLDIAFFLLNVKLVTHQFWRILLYWKLKKIPLALKHFVPSNIINYAEISTAATQTTCVLICLPLSFHSSTALDFLLFGSAAAPDLGTRTRRTFSSGAFVRDALPILRLCKAEIRWQQSDGHTESISTSAHSGKTWVKKEIHASFLNKRRN